MTHPGNDVDGPSTACTPDPVAAEVIEVSPSELRVVNAVRAGASTAEEIAAVIGTTRDRAMRLLGLIGDALGVRRNRRHRGCDVAEVVDAVRRAGKFSERMAKHVDAHASSRCTDADLREPPGIEWPYYGGANDLGAILETFRSMKRAS